MISDGPHILLIDDDIRLRELLHKYLSENNFRVTAADNAIVARGQMKRVYFDLLVLDLMMPGENGLEFAKSIRSMNNLSRDVPILIVGNVPSDGILIIAKSIFGSFATNFAMTVFWSAIVTWMRATPSTT